jgi:hypothetical protein
MSAAAARCASVGNSGGTGSTDSSGGTGSSDTAGTDDGDSNRRNASRRVAKDPLP